MSQVVRAAEQVRETRLMPGSGELADTVPTHRGRGRGVGGAEDGRGLREAAPRLNRVDRRLGVAKTHNHCKRPLTFQPVSSGATTGLPRIAAPRAR